MAEGTRQTRKNETMILGMLSALSEKLGGISTDMALLKQGQGVTNEHLNTLNGKVVAHENRLNDQTLINQKNVDALNAIVLRLGAYDESKKEDGAIWRNFRSQIGWGAFVILMTIFYKVLVVAGIISDFLHKA